MSSRSKSDAGGLRETMAVLDLLVHDLGNSAQEVLANLELSTARKGSDLTSVPIGSGVEAMHRMAQNIQTAIRARTTPYVPEAIPLRIAVQSAGIKACRMAGYHVEPVISCDSGSEVRADPMLIDALAEMMLNSIQASGSGTRISVQCEERDDRTLIVYEDGSVRADLPQIERSLHRLEKLLDVGDFHGSGTGLSMVKAIVDRYGGKISVRYRVDRDPASGLLFEVMLPQ